MNIQHTIKSKFDVWWLQVLVVMVSSGFLSILYVYFVKNEVPFEYILLAEGLGYGGSVIVILLKRSFYSRRDIQLGLAIVLLALLSLFLPITPIGLLIVYVVFRVIGSILFYVPYNILFFAETNKEKKLYRMTVYWAIGAIVGIVAPITGGYIMTVFGWNVFLSIAIGLLLFTIGLTSYIKKEVYAYTPKQVLLHIKGLRTITMFDGALLNASRLLVVLYLITFVSNEFDFGKILSLIALVSVIFSFRVAKFSDAYKKRTIFIYPLSFILAAIFVGLYFAQSFFVILLLVIVYRFFSTLMNPIRANILLDAVENEPLTWIARDIYLNIGRFSIFVFFAVILQFGVLRESFLIMGALFAIFPLILAKKNIYKKVSK